MTTDELIKALREYAEADEMPLRLVREALTEAADRLENLDERVAIMEEGRLDDYDAKKHSGLMEE